MLIRSLYLIFTEQQFLLRQCFERKKSPVIWKSINALNLKKKGRKKRGIRSMWARGHRHHDCNNDTLFKLIRDFKTVSGNSGDALVV